MVGWIILGIIVFLIVGILLIPVGVDTAYEGGQFRLSAKAAGLLLQLYPKPPDSGKKPKEEKPKEEQKPKEEKPEAEKKKGLPFGLNKDELLEIVQIALKGVGRFRRKLSVDRFLLHFTAAGKDPYDTAMTFAYVNEALSILAPICRNSLKVRKADVRTDVDFLGESIKLDAALALTIRIGQIFGVVNAIAFGAIKVILRSKRRQKKEARLLKAEGANQTETETKTIQEEERMESNG